MTEWMEYLHMNRPVPQNATGVSVHLTAIDPNGNFQEIGTTTSDASSNYGMVWTPPVPGLYKVTATFEGSESYYSSSAETMFVVSTSPTPTPTPTPAPSPVAGPNVVPLETFYAFAALLVVLIIAVAVLLYRKK